MTPQNFDLNEALNDNKLLQLWRLMTGFRWPYIMAIVCLALAALTQTGTYYLLRYFVDEVLQAPAEKQAEILPLLALSLIGLALIQGLFSFLSGRLAAKTAQGIVQRLRDYLYDHIQRLSFSYHDRMQTGELLQRATSDVDTLRRWFGEQLIEIGRISLLFLVNFIAVLNLNLSLALWSVIVIPFVLLISFFFFQKVEKAYEAYQDQEANLSNRFQEYLTGVRVVKAFARQAYERDKFQAENAEKLRRGQKLTLMHSTFWPLTDILCGAQMLFGYFMAAQMTIAGTISVGTYLAYAGLLIWIIWPIRNLGRLITQMSMGFVSYERIIEVIRETREPLDEGTYMPPNGLQGIIHFENVGFAYDKETPVLHNISFEAQAGQVIALLGATGSGKTSLINLLPRFYEYSSGKLTLDGVDLRDYRREYLRQQIGIVQQEPFLFSRTIRENITYGVGRNVSDEEVEAAARAAAIHDVILSFPAGYNTLVGERGVTLSGGQKQRVTIARTLLKNPRILILDDATSSVDTETEASIREALQGVIEKRTTFIIAHRIQSVMDADMILVLNEGHIVQCGSHRELIAQPGFYQQIYNLQAQIENELQEEMTSLAMPTNKQVNGYQQRSAKPKNN